MQGNPGGAPPGYPHPGYPQPGYPQYPGQPVPGSQAASPYPAVGYGAQPAAGYGPPGAVYGQPAMQAANAQPAAQQQPHPPVRPEDVEFQLPPDGKQAELGY